MISWYLKKLIKDKILVSQNKGENDSVNNGNNMYSVQIYKQEVGFNFTRIVPTNSSFLDPNTCKSYCEATMKFDVSNLD